MRLNKEASRARERTIIAHPAQSVGHPLRHNLGTASVCLSKRAASSFRPSSMSSAPDDVLDLLRRRGRAPERAELEALMRGVAAAPEGLAGPEWIELIDPQPDADLRQALQAWRTELARADDGLEVSPAPAERLAILREELRRRGL